MTAGEGQQTAWPAPLWRNPNFMFLWSGALVSNVGSRVSAIGFPLLVLALTHSPAQMGIVAALRSLPYLFLSLPVGALIDRWDRKRVMILCDAGRAVNMLSIPLALWLAHLSIWQLYANATIAGILLVFFDVAEATCLPYVVPSEQLTAAVVQDQTARQGTALVGPSLGGLLFQLGHAVPFLADGISYAASVISLAFIKVSFQGERAPKARNLRAEIAEGIRWLWNHSVIRLVAFCTGGLSLAVSSVSLITIVLAQHQHASAGAIGAIFSAAGLGGVLGALVASRVLKRLGFGRVIISMSWLFVALWPLLAVAPNPVALGVVLGAIAFVIPIHGIAIVSYRLAVTPDELQGRVASVVRLIAWSTEPAGLALAGFLVQGIGASTTVLVLAGWIAVVALATTLNRPLRQVVGPPVKSGEAAPAATHHCSFCGKSNQQVAWIIAGGDGVTICSACIDRCNEMIRGQQEQPAHGQ